MDAQHEADQVYQKDGEPLLPLDLDSAEGGGRKRHFLGAAVPRERKRYLRHFEVGAIALLGADRGFSWSVFSVIVFWREVGCVDTVFGVVFYMLG